MAKFIIGIDAFSNPEELEEEFITHTEFPKFIAEIVFAESFDKLGFRMESLDIIWNEPCEKEELATAMKEAKEAIEFYTAKSMELGE